MEYVIQVLENDLRLINEGLRSWGRGFQEEKKRQENKAKEIRKAIKQLTNGSKNNN